MAYEQLPDGQWRKVPTATEYEPQPVRIWYMRDNHTFRALPLDVDQAIEVMRNEFETGETYGMLCGNPSEVLSGVVHARGAADWLAFEAAARAWLQDAIAKSKPPTGNEGK